MYVIIGINIKESCTVKYICEASQTGTFAAANSLRRN